jgi:hypothetical protein
MSTVIMERYITSHRDMDDVESTIAAQLGGENGRCAFLRSLSYRLLRMAVLYKQDQRSYTAHHGNLIIAYEPTGEGKRVTIKCLDPPFNEEYDEPAEWNERKAPRRSSL